MRYSPPRQRFLPFPMLSHTFNTHTSHIIVCFPYKGTNRSSFCCVFASFPPFLSNRMRIIDTWRIWIRNFLEDDNTQDSNARTPTHPCRIPQPDTLAVGDGVALVDDGNMDAAIITNLCALYQSTISIGVCAAMHFNAMYTNMLDFGGAARRDWSQLQVGVLMQAAPEIHICTLLWFADELHLMLWVNWLCTYIGCALPLNSGE